MAAAESAHRPIWQPKFWGFRPKPGLPMSHIAELRRPSLICSRGKSISLSILADNCSTCAVGRLRALAVVGPARVAAIPDVKTFKELGIDGMEVANSWYAIAAPADTPPEIIQTLNVSWCRSGNARHEGCDPRDGPGARDLDPEEMTEAWRSELNRLGPIVKQINISAQ